MKKRRIWLLVLIVVFILALLGAGGFLAYRHFAGRQGAGVLQPKSGEEAPAQIEDMNTLKEEILFLLKCGDERAQAAYDRQAVYFYSTAAAHVCALRYMADNILWLKGEGETVSDLSGERLADWNEIAALNYVSPYAGYCRYLVLKMQGKDDEAVVYLEQAQENPDCPQEDAFYDWKEKSVRELYGIKDELEGLEDEIFARYAPMTRPLEILTGAEFSQEYHLYLAQACLEQGQPRLALVCAENAICVNPFNGKGYAFGALAALDMEDSELAAAYLNEGFAAEPVSVEINVLLAAAAKSRGDGEAFSRHLEIARQGQPGEKMAAFIDALEGGEAE